MFRAQKAYEVNEDVKYVEFFHCDMKGWIPARLKNMMFGVFASVNVK